jgi:hypothetical protein
MCLVDQYRAFPPLILVVDGAVMRAASRSIGSRSVLHSIGDDSAAASDSHAAAGVARDHPQPGASTGGMYDRDTYRSPRS